MSDALFCVEVNENTSPLVQQFLFEKGYLWGGESNNVSYTDKKYLFPWTDGTICYCDYNNDNDCIELSFAEFAHWVITNEMPAKSIGLNQKYIAYVYNDRVEVGCQTFSKEKAIEFANLILKQMGDNYDNGESR